MERGKHKLPPILLLKLHSFVLSSSTNRALPPTTHRMMGLVISRRQLLAPFPPSQSSLSRKSHNKLNARHTYHTDFFFFLLFLYIYLVRLFLVFSFDFFVPYHNFFPTHPHNLPKVSYAPAR